jgi:hypothetical protein
MIYKVQTRYKRITGLAAVFISSLIAITACLPSRATDTSLEHSQDIQNSPILAVDTPSLTPTATTTPTATPQPTETPISVGPEQSDVPPGFNPLTGLPVADPSLLKIPALLISIPHFPPEARPQAGLSFAPWVFEYLISKGSTRFLAAFYGQYPHPITPVTGDCEVRNEPFVQSGLILGNRIWLDQNVNGVQDPDEPGLGGVCVKLYEADGQLAQQTTSDSNGYYAFNVGAGQSYQVEFVKPAGMDFTQPNVGDENHDSDADPETGRTDPLTVSADNRLVDAGLIPPAGESQTATIQTTQGQVGPVRSGRLVYIHIQKFFQNSCLIYAGATREIRDQLPLCATVFGLGDAGVGSMLDITRMIKIAQENAARKGSDFNYASNLFSDQVPAGGQPASELDVFVALLNQSKWVYDPAYQGWLRYVDNTSPDTVFHVDTDRLTGRQVAFENVIVLEADHEVFSPTIIDMNLQQGESGNAFLFRDGRVFKIKWNTRATAYEQKTGLRQPIAFQDENGDPIALHPGHTWIFITTPYSDLSETASGQWRLHVVAPPGVGYY